jgi:hypothetical protein
VGGKGAKHGKVTVGGKAAAKVGGWGSRPARGAELAAAVADTVKPPPGRKNKRRWCRGKPGVEHRPAAEVHSYYGRTYVCGWQKTGYYVLVEPLPVYPRGVPVPKRRRWGKREFVVTGREWRCYHELKCAECGKWLGLVSSCPDRPEEGGGAR